MGPACILPKITDKGALCEIPALAEFTDRHPLPLLEAWLDLTDCSIVLELPVAMLPPDLCKAPTCCGRGPEGLSLDGDSFFNKTCPSEKQAAVENFLLPGLLPDP